MRQGFVHEAVLAIAPDADERAPGAAINSALAAGSLVGPEGVTTRWQLAATRVRSPQPDGWEHLDRLSLD